MLIKGVLIHMNPESLPAVYEALHKATGRYLLVCEYYNPTPVAVTYRGHTNRLFKRDFCGEIMTAFPTCGLPTTASRTGATRASRRTTSPGF